MNINTVIQIVTESKAFEAIRQRVRSIWVELGPLRASGFVGILLLFLVAPMLMGAYEQYMDNGSGLLPRLLLVGSIIGMLVFMTANVPQLGVPMMLTYLVLFGFIRRSLIPLLGHRDSDPMTLIGPIVAGMFFVNQLLNRSIQVNTLITRLVCVLLVLMAFAIINPLGGAGVIGNAAGAIFYMVPLFWFFYGRKVANPKIVTDMISVCIVLSVLTALYGLYQTFFGFSENERIWMELTQFSQFLSAKTSRVFSTFNGVAEYFHFLGIGAVLCWARFSSGKRPYILPFLLLICAVFLSSSRGILASTLAGCIVVSAVRGKTIKSWIPRLAVALIAVILGVTFGLQKAVDTAGQTKTGEILRHQTVLADPFGEKSTGTAHVTLISQGIMAGLKNPIGRGLAAGTIADSKYQSEGTSNAEFDVGNVFLALGAIGGVVYIVLYVVIMICAGKVWFFVRHESLLAVIGVLVVEQGQWLSGGHYLPTFIIWFLIGFVERVYRWHQAQAVPGGVNPQTSQTAGIRAE